MLNPEVLRFIPMDTEFDMTNLLTEVVNRGLPVSAFPIHEQWIDIGQIEDLKRARNTLNNQQNHTEDGQE